MRAAWGRLRDRAAGFVVALVFLPAYVLLALTLLLLLASWGAPIRRNFNSPG